MRVGQEVQALPRQAELTPPVPRIHVVAGVLQDEAGDVLVAQRPPGKSLAGGWEFPGGKLAAGEGRLEGLARELEEELGIRLDPARCRPLIRYVHRYPERVVELDVWRVGAWNGELHGRENQALDWRRPEVLLASGLLPADAPVVNALQLPPLVAVTPFPDDGDEGGFLDRIELLASGGGPLLVCLRRADLDLPELLELAAGAACRVDGTSARLLLHGDPWGLVAALDSAPPALRARLDPALAGIHAPGRYLERAGRPSLPAGLWLGYSCHDAAQLAHALDAGAGYAFLGPVHATASHPGQPGMEWEAFEALVGELPLPVFAIGGLGPADLETAWAHGAQGIAAIRGLWPS
nr:Nudix family hydrolase [Thioalkalivibrio sp. XN8]